MIRNEDFLELRESYIEIGKMVQKYGYGQYNGILRILMGQVNCIDSDENDGKKMKYLTESYSKLFALGGGLSDFMIYDAHVQLRNQLNVKKIEMNNLEHVTCHYFENTDFILRTCCANRKVTYDGRPVKEILTGNAELNATIPETILDWLESKCG